jgi:hypothetical protein
MTNTKRHHHTTIEAAKKHGVPFSWRSPGTLLFPADSVRKVIEEVQLNGGKVIGMEGFELDGDVIHPRIDLIYDASRNPASPVDVLANWDRWVWVDLTLGE